MRTSPEELIHPSERRQIGEASRAKNYSSAVRLSLDPEMSASQALVALFQHLLDIMRATERGLASRLSEMYLHDYRVAVRRTRSALSHFGDILPPATLTWAKSFFRDVGRRTGTARDLDVLLLELPGYTRSLPVDTRRALSQTVGRCERDAELEYATLGHWLATPRYRGDLERWQRSIDELAKSRCDRTIAAAAATAIEAAAARAFRQMEKLGKAKNEKKVHRLRIRCKKLRYALEFSRSLTPGGEIEELITSLKRLQDVLGTFNDLVVHEAKLRRSVETSVETSAGTPAGTDLASATDRLLAELEGRRRKIRKQTHSAVRQFQQDGPPQLEHVLARLRAQPV